MARPYLFRQWDPKQVGDVLSRLVTDNMIVFVMGSAAELQFSSQSSR